jgi:aromatic ring-opening dioxygenase catalytic subunit (LigB family)
MLTSRALLVPSLPTLLIDEQRGTTTEMLAAFAAQAGELEAEGPEAYVVVSSRWLSAGGFLVDDAREHRSLIDLPGFGVEPRYDCAGEPALAQAILEQARRAGLRASAARRGVDSGTSVPMHFLARSRRARVVPASLSSATADEHRRWGACLRKVLAGWSARVAFVVSGGLTFNPHEFNLKRENPEVRELDGQVLEALQRGEWSRLAALEHGRGARAQAEAGWRHLEVLRGFLGGDLSGRVCAYESLPGFGAALVKFEIAAEVAAA